DRISPTRSDPRNARSSGYSDPSITRPAFHEDGVCRGARRSFSRRATPGLQGSGRLVLEPVLVGAAIAGQGVQLAGGVAVQAAVGGGVVDGLAGAAAAVVDVAAVAGQGVDLTGGVAVQAAAVVQVVQGLRGVAGVPALEGAAVAGRRVHQTLGGAVEAAVGGRVGDGRGGGAAEQVVPVLEGAI